VKHVATVLSILLGSLCLGPNAAQAVSFYFSPPTPAAVSVGETFDVTFRMDTQGETEITTVFISVYANPDLLQFVSGSSPGMILLDWNTLTGIPVIGQPKRRADDPPGVIRATNFSAGGPSGVASADELLATMTFRALGAGTTRILAGASADDEVWANGAPITPSIELHPSLAIAIVPEPSMAILLGLGIASLSRRARRAV
jgi:hypothetical protein